MQASNIASAKSNFSRLIEQVKQGETILIMERNKPVATLQPVNGASGVDALYVSGLLNPPRHGLDLGAFLAASRAELAEESSLSSAVVSEREEGR